MLTIQKITLSIMAVAVTFAVASFVGSAVAQQKSGVQKAPDKVALSTDEVKQLVLMMDTDKSGELDVKELAQSQLRPSAKPPTGK
jgi:hypothetical protein